MKKHVGTNTTIIYEHNRRTQRTRERIIKTIRDEKKKQLINCRTYNGIRLKYPKYDYRTCWLVILLIKFVPSTQVLTYHRAFGIANNTKRENFFSSGNMQVLLTLAAYIVRENFEKKINSRRNTSRTTHVRCRLNLVTSPPHDLLQALAFILFFFN